MNQDVQEKTHSLVPHLFVFKICLLFLLFFTAVSAQAQVSATIDTTSIKIGEEILYTIQADVDSTAVVVFPEGQQFLPLEVIESYKADTLIENARYRLIKKYGLTQFDSGSYRIPSQRVIINDQIYKTDTLAVAVRDVVVDTTKQKMFDIKTRIEVDRPPFNFKKALVWFLPLSLIFVAIAAIIFFILKRRKQKAEKNRVLPPYEEALVALRELDSKPLLVENKSKEYYSNLTEIVKRYLDREVDDTALESTTDELIARLQLHKKAGHWEFDKDAIQQLDAILKRADLVKFAKMQQAAEQAQADRAVIGHFIDETHESIPEPTEEEKERDAAYADEIAKKKKRRNIIYAVLSGIALLIIAAGLSIAVWGWDDVRDAVFGNETRELSNSKWYHSEYGNPALIMDTPEILIRKSMELPEDAQGAVKSTDLFEYRASSDSKPFTIQAFTAQYNEGFEVENEEALSAAVESVLASLENNGALNMTVKQEAFSTDGGIDGLKAYGEYNLKGANGTIFEDRIAYEMMLFKQNKGLQYVLIVYVKDDFYATEMKNRIVRSVEIEVEESQSNNTQQP